MDRSVLMAIAISFLFLLFLLMFLGWRARKRRQSGIQRPLAAPPESELGRLEGTFEGFYVATTAAGNPLDRIAVRGLGFRAKSFVIVAEAGVVVQIPGEDDPFIPVDDVRNFHEATWTIDRVVEEKGLQVLTWTLGDTQVDSYFRMEQPKAFANAIEAMRHHEASRS